MKKIGFHTLGCRVNDYLTTHFQETARRQGWQIVRRQDPAARAYLINTCLVTRGAESKSRQAIRRLRRQNPAAKIIVTGCLAAMESKNYPRPPEADFIFYEKKDFGRILNKIDARLPNNIATKFKTGLNRSSKSTRPSIPPSRIRANLMIATGCGNNCSYCIVRAARGKLVSRRPEEILAEARGMISRGVKEIVVTGINLGSYGKDQKKKSSLLPELLECLDKLPGLIRWRLSSLEPQEVTSQLVKTLSQAKKFCRFLHFPLQSGSAAILKKMNRPYAPADYARLIKQIRRLMPDILLGTDIITGFPGESKKEFKQTLNFLKKIVFYRLHVFPFSARPGTPAAKLKPIDPRIIRQRVEILKKLRLDLLHETHQALIGQKVAVLTEQEKAVSSSRFEAKGLTAQYIRVIFEASRGALGRLVPVIITENKCEYLKGRAI